MFQGLHGATGWIPFCRRPYGVPVSEALASLGAKPDELAQHFGIHFDGLLGQDILNQFRSVRIDYKTHTIDLER